MKRNRIIAAACALACALMAAPAADSLAAASGVTQERALAADADSKNWMLHGRTYAEQRYSPLAQVNRETVGKLGLAWSYDMRTQRGVEATPIVVDGVMYVTGAWSIVYALNAKTGKELWVYDPKVAKSTVIKSCCDAVNRGVAVWNNNVYVATLDGRLVALNARSGKVLWQKVTVDQSDTYVITSAPRVAKGMVFIGNSGGDMGVRGYVSAYDAATGAMKWRFYTVPGNPAKGPDGAASDDVLEKMAKTWNGEWWKYGGGGTVWDAMTYDPELDQLYIGVGNGSPWNHQIRSPGGGDNLFLASVVALNPNTGKYLWHYQATPGDSWDATATQQMMLATMQIDGRQRKVLMQAPKNGFFYVIDRTNGKLISAKNIVPMAPTKDTPPGAPISWAYGVDLETGRPLENPEARYPGGTKVSVHPVGPGAHGWQPMAMSPQTGLVYLPIQDFAITYQTDPDFKFIKGRRAMGVASHGGLPEDPVVRKAIGSSIAGRLLAWDPVAQKEVWSVQQKYTSNGGVLATGGGLVFEGLVDGSFVAYDAATGTRLWSHDIQNYAQGGPITYEIDGVQYIAAAAGNGGSTYLVAGPGVPADMPPLKGRVVVFRLDGKAKLPPVTWKPLPVPPPPTVPNAAAIRDLGARVYAANCVGCHGISTISGNVIPDLRRSPIIQSGDAFKGYVIGGWMKEAGMPSFGDILTPDEAEAVRAYVAREAELLFNSKQTAPTAAKP
ncbi:MAG: PQQ-dependent dehydrogenase, methanol/ethanol family [Pseudomonadota bacterium]